MPIIHSRKFKEGYNGVIDSRISEQSFMLMDFGIHKLRAGSVISVLEEKEECVFMLIEGNISYKWNGKTSESARNSCFDDIPELLHVSKATLVTIAAKKDSEIIFVKTRNDVSFESKFYTKNDCRVEMFGEGVLNGTALRKVRTVFDYSNAPYSNLVVGELINFPGKWSSYPPHTHVHPEFYYYRFDKPQGFGCSFQGENVFKIMHNDTVTIPGGLVHPQVAAPGYPMYYCWVIRHLEGNPWNSRECVPEHEWLEDKNAKIWSEKK